ncbi:unnamed protein product [Trifolium pratense]|uniref:Uncharacterized protein n=1 Tax=Trifolium pratense TaxID=57577 RepID=A0ACB0MFN7_TRIPR|nr:unnamed protein product [Trifolium pratense]
MQLKLCEASSEEEEGEDWVEEQKEEVELVEELKTLQLSLQSKEGFTSNKSFKVWADIGGRRVLTLIDSGATSNFIASKLVNELSLAVTETPAYIIEVGNGEKVKNHGVCEELGFSIQDVKFQQHFFIMELGGSEMVLGMDWLASLGNIEANFGNLCLKWEVQGNKYMIQGDPSMCSSQVNCRTLLKAISKEGMGFYVHEVQAENQSNHGINSDWEEVIARFEEVYKKIAGLVFWEGMRKNIKAYVESCEVCQRNKYQTLSPGGLLQPLPIPTQLWSDISMDFIGGLPKVQGVDTIMVVVDRLTKYAHFLPVKHPYTAKDIAELFIKEIVRLHGFPSSIVSDRDRVFLSSFWTELFKQAGTKLKYSSAYHPQSDGQTEVVNRCLETYLRCLTGRQPKMWPKWLAWAEYWYNTNYHASIKSTPFEALYGRSPPILVRGDVQLSAVEEVNKLTAERNEMIREMKDQLLKAQDQMRVQANKHRREVDYQVGDMVYLKIQPYKLQKLAKRFNQKLSPRYYGPYEILERVGAVAYKLKLPEDSRVHPVFHASLLKKAVSTNVETQPLPTCMNESWQLEPGPEEARDTRVNEKGELELLVKWQGLLEIENSWELVQKMRQEFPDFLFEVKESLEGGGIDRYDIVYTRKRKNKERGANSHVVERE